MTEDELNLLTATATALRRLIQRTTKDVDLLVGLNRALRPFEVVEVPVKNKSGPEA